MSLSNDGFYGTYTEIARDCKHMLHHSDTGPTYANGLSRWAEPHEPVDLVCTSEYVPLCPRCEAEMRAELAAASARTIQDLELHEREQVRARKRYVRAATKVANHQETLADQTETVAKWEAQKEAKRVWEEGRKVVFEVGEGMGAGEVGGKEKAVICLDW